MPNKSMLVVDDNPSNLKLVKLLLQSYDYDIRTAFDANDTMNVLSSFQPKIILMDIQLPGMSGLELTSKLRSDHKYHDVIILAITAYAMKGDEDRALAAGCDGYIPKPIDTRTLPDVIAKYMREGRKILTNEIM